MYIPLLCSMYLCSKYVAPSFSYKFIDFSQDKLQKATTTIILVHQSSPPSPNSPQNTQYVITLFFSGGQDAGKMMW